MTDERIFDVYEFQMLELKKRLAKLNKCAKKIGCSDIEIFTHSEEFVIDPRVIKPLIEKYGSLEALPNEPPKVKLLKISLKGEAPKLSGYRFVGTLDHHTIPGNVIVNKVPGEEVPKEFYDCSPLCAHCNKIRNRIETFVVLNEESGKHFQVGRNCLRDFLGHNPNQVTNFLLSWFTIVDDLTDAENFSGSGRIMSYIESKKVLTVTSAVIRTFGWIARSKAGFDETPTADLVVKVFFDQNDTYYNEFIDSIQFDEERDLENANKALEWLKEQPNKNEYIHNLKTLSELDSIPVNMFGYWCSLISSYYRDVEYNKEKESTPVKNEFIGKEKDRLELNIKCVGFKYIAGYYGTTTLHQMVDGEGRKLNWFSSCGEKMDKDKSYKIKGTVKKHNEYKGTKQTILSRVSVIDELGTPVEELRKEIDSYIDPSRNEIKAAIGV